jgi:6-phosphofructokinase 1
MADMEFTPESLGVAEHENPLGLGTDTIFVNDSERLMFDPHLSTVQKAVETKIMPRGFELAGPRARSFFMAKNVHAAIVTCGGLCPGLNAVVRGIVHQLWFRYGCHRITGIRYGYNGLGPDAQDIMPLTPDDVAPIHTLGGTILGSSRGTPPTHVIVDRLVALGINQLYVIGGDGTMRGGLAIWKEIKKRNLRIAVVGIPKTIDNDIPYVRKSFGFETAVGLATQTVHAAHTEAIGTLNGIGLVKLMGRNSGYITANAALASGHANFCLVPEIPFKLEGEKGLFSLLRKRLKQRGHAVIVLAEGAGQDFFSESERERDASGNLKLINIGRYTRDRITDHFKGSGLGISLKYIDPSYIIRAAAANPADQLLCLRFAQNAVHAAMAGKTGLLVGYWHGQMTHVPMASLAGETQRINPKGELWFNILETTGQPESIV